MCGKKIYKMNNNSRNTFLFTFTGNRLEIIIAQVNVRTLNAVAKTKLDCNIVISFFGDIHARPSSVCDFVATI